MYVSMYVVVVVYVCGACGVYAYGVMYVCV